MKLRGLLVSVALLAVLGGLVYWSEKKSGGTKGPSEDPALKMLAIPGDQVKELRLKRTVDTTLVRRDEGGKWQIVEPAPLRADQEAVDSLVSNLSSLSADTLIEEKAADLEPYGLAPPTLEVDIARADGKTDALQFGDEIPTGTGYYAKVGGDPRVFTVTIGTKLSFDKGSNDLRDKRLLTFDSEKLTRVALTAGGQTVEFGKNAQNDWAILSPRPLRADGSEVEELVRRLKDAKMDTLVTPGESKKAAAAFASGIRVASATVFDNAGKQQLEIRRDRDWNYYARSSEVEGVWKVASDLGTGLDKKLDDLRNRKLFDFAWSDPGKVEVRAGANPVTYAKEGGKWMAGSRQMDSPSAQVLIEKLRDLSATRFPESAPAGAPVFEATVTSDNGKRVEKVMVSKAGEKYFAKRDGEPGIYEIDATAAEELQKAAADVKEYQPPTKK